MYAMRVQVSADLAGSTPVILSAVNASAEANLWVDGGDT